MIRMGGRGNKVGFIHGILIHISRRRRSRREFATLVSGSYLGCQGQRIKNRVLMDVLVGMIGANNTTIDQLFKLIIIDAVS